MKPLNIEILKRLTSNVLETTCFLFQSEAGNGVQNTENQISVSIQCGTRFGIYLTFEQSLSQDIAENMLGMPPEELDKELTESSLKEITNMVGGNFMNAVNLPASTKLSIPEILQPKIEQGKIKPVTDMLSDVIHIDERPVKITLVEYAS